MSDVQNIINLIAPYCQVYAKKYGYKVCSPAIAQALQESYKGEGKGNNGLSTLAYKYNNYHGIKAYPKWTGASVNMKTGEETPNGSMIYIKSNFCVFQNVANAMEEYFLFLERNPRYKPVKESTTAYSYLDTIKKCGYCTDSAYVTSCMGKVERYNLTQYDEGAVVNGLPVYARYSNYKLTANLYIRSEAGGEKVKFECITQNAKAYAHFDDYGNAILNEGTVVTCLDLANKDGNMWLKIPSGWVCGYTASGRIYIQ